MKAPNFINRILNRKRIKAQSRENDFIIATPTEQILTKLKSISKDESNYHWILTEMKIHLNYKEVECLIHKSNSLQNKDVFITAFEKEKNHWKAEIKNDFIKNIKDAKLSLCTSDYLAHIIGTKYDLYMLIGSSSLWKEYYIELESELNLILIQNDLLLSLEADNKAHVPVNYALSMFLLYDKNIATSKFKRILSNDRLHRLEALHQAEYFLTIDKFFSRLKLNFVPQIKHTNHSDPITFHNMNNQYITREEIQILIDNEDFFNKREFSVDIKKLLKPKNINNRELILESYFMFFKSLDKSVDRKNIEILISCFTETNPGYQEIEIRSTRFLLNNLLSDQKQHVNFINLNYYLFYYKGEFSVARNNLAFLLFKFFNGVTGMGIESIKDVFYRNLADFDTSLSKELRSFMDKYSA